MAFKNAFKMILSKFGYVWVLLLYIVIAGAIVTGLSVPFAVPVVRAFRQAGVGKMISTLYANVTHMRNAETWAAQLGEIWRVMRTTLVSDRTAVINTVLLFSLVLTVAYRFVIGLYELPLCIVLEGAMSSNARIGFVGRFISGIGKSACFVLVKMLYTIVADALICGSVYGVLKLCGALHLRLLAPFAVTIVLLILLGLRYTFICMWAPDIAVRDRGIFASFAFSCKRAAKHFGSVFSSYLCAWTVIIAFNFLLGVFTFGAGLILTVPLSVLFLRLLNMTVYYGKNGKRYYVDYATVVTPPVDLAPPEEA